MTVASHSPEPSRGTRAALVVYDEYERQRVEHLVLGRPRPKPSRNRVRKGKVAPIVRLAPGVEEAVQLREEWSHKADGTPATHAHAAAMRRREGCLARLVATGALDVHQLAAAEEIATAHAAIAADVAVRTAKLEPRGTGGGPDAAAAVHIRAVLREQAYSRWRAAVGADGAMLLAIIVDDMALTTAARRWRKSNRRTRAILVRALDGWRRV
ncbi:hypothetical protein [Sphingomonas sp. VNH70]|uniref:hypothetical protein n=1 Tax=Sphingomonas silueang TaxID=3156617 RepID=UPI0032B4A3AA